MKQRAAPTGTELPAFVSGVSWKRREFAGLGGIEAALHRSSHGEGSVFRLPEGVVGVSLHLSERQRTATRLAGGPWQEYTDLRGAVSVVLPGQSVESVGLGPSEDLHVLLPEELLGNVSHELNVPFQTLELRPVLAQADPALARLLGGLADELSGEDLGRRLSVESLATAVAVSLLRRYSSLDSGWARDRAVKIGTAQRRAVRRALEYIGHHLSEDLSLDALARASNVSGRHLSRLFREAVGMSLHQYVIRERVERARSLLRQAELTVAEVAVLSGFAHHQHLNRHFKRLTGVSPQRFREENRHPDL